MTKKGDIYILEGGEYGGKTENSLRLVEHLKNIGREVIRIREPGTTPTSEAIRKVLLEDESVDLLPSTEALLFYAARAQSTAEIVRPAHEAGVTVVFDRSAYSTLAYQVKEDDPKSISMEEAEMLGKIAMREIYALGKVAIINISLEEMYNRMKAASATLDKIEKKPPAYHRNVLFRYRVLAEMFPQATLIDGMQGPDDVFSDIIDAFGL